MPLFDYTASDRDGVLSHGQIEASDRQRASHQLAQQGLFVLGVSPATSSPNLAPSPPPGAAKASVADAALRGRLEAAAIDDESTVAVDTVKSPSSVGNGELFPQRTWSRMDRALYLRQLQVMFQAGVPLYRSAAVLSEGAQYNRRVSARLGEVPVDLERGRMLSKALERSGLFTPLIVSSVRLGEESGRLDAILAALSDTEERTVKLTRALVSRLTYPAVVLLAMSGGLLLLGHVMSRVMTSLPAFQASGLGMVTSCFQSPAFLPGVLLLMGVLLAATARLWTSTNLRLMVELRVLRSPVLGALVRRLEANTVTSHLALLCKAGLPLDRGLGLCADLVRTESFRQALLRSQRDLRDGEELSGSFQSSALFPEDVLALVQAGEVSGSLEASLDTASSYCAEQVDRTLETALSVLEPVLIGLLGIAIGTVLLLTFVPIFDSLKDL